MKELSIFDRLKWWYFKYLWQHLCLYHRMKAILWTKSEHHKWLDRNFNDCLVDD